MNAKTYRGRTAKEVLARVSRELGPDADIIGRRLLKDENGDTVVEVTATPRVLGKAAQIQPFEPSPLSVAVLAFADLSPNKDQEYFCDGISEEIIHKLARIENLKVIARTSSFYFKGKDVDISEIGRQLGVSTILDGSVRKSGDKLRVSAQLINVSDKSNFLSISFDREQQDIFAIQEEIALAVVDALKCELGVEERKRVGESHETSPDVYELYLQGRFASNFRIPERLEMAIGFFDRAIEKDPSFAPAFAMKTLCHYDQIIQFAPIYPLGPTYQKALLAVARAEELNPELADVHLALAETKSLYEADWKGAEREYTRALELSPGRGDIHASYGSFYLQVIGRFDEAIAEMKIAMDLDPFSINARMDFGEVYFAAGRFEEAAGQFKSVNEMSPNYWASIAWQAFAYAGMTQAEEAIALLNKLEFIAGKWDRPRLLWAQALVHALLGRKEEAKIYLEQLKKIRNTIYYYPTVIAVVSALLGEIDSALEWLNKAIEERDPHRFVHISADFGWGDLKSDPRFDEFLKRAGLPTKQ